jgi:hypothetical protein
MMLKIYSGLIFVLTSVSMKSMASLCCLGFMNAAIDQQCEFIKSQCFEKVEAKIKAIYKEKVPRPFITVIYQQEMMV